MGLMRRMLDHTRFDRALPERDLPQLRSNRVYCRERLILQFMHSVWYSANRFQHGKVIHHDPVLRRLFGFQCMVNFKAVKRPFRKFSQAAKEHVLVRLVLLVFLRRLRSIGLALDFDSTVMTRYRTRRPQPSVAARSSPIGAPIIS